MVSLVLFSLYFSSLFSVISSLSSPPTDFSISLSGSAVFPPSSSSAPQSLFSDTLSPSAIPSPVGPSTITLSAPPPSPSPCSFSLCLLPFTQAPYNVSIWPQSCRLFLSLPSSSASSSASLSTYSLPALSVPHISIYSALSAAAPHQQNVSCDWAVSIQGKGCAAGTYPNPSGNDCVTPLYIPTSSTSPSVVTIDSSSPYALISTNPSTAYSSSLTLTASLSPSSRDRNVSFTLYVNENNAPLFNLSAPSLSPLQYENVSAVPAGGAGDLTLSLPTVTANNGAPYVFSITPTSPSSSFSSSLSVNMNEIYCSPQYFGPQCGYNVPLLVYTGKAAAVELFNQVFYANSFYYYQLVFSSPLDQRFYFGVKALSSAFTPNIYMRRGNLPSLTQYDLFIPFNASDPQERILLDSGVVPSLSSSLWYVGLYYAPSQTVARGDVVGVWWNSPCPSNCSYTAGNGHCVDPLHGVCECTEDYNDEFDCSRFVAQDNRLSKAAKAALGVVASVGSVLLGVALCWYFRRDNWFQSNRMPGDAGYRVGGGGGGGGAAAAPARPAAAAGGGAGGAGAGGAASGGAGRASGSQYNSL